MQEDLINYGPIVVDVVASYSFFYTGSSGIVDCSKTTYLPVDHNVLLVGYTETHWIIKNSYGPTWGDKGFGYISKS